MRSQYSENCSGVSISPVLGSVMKGAKSLKLLRINCPACALNPGTVVLLPAWCAMAAYILGGERERGRRFPSGSISCILSCRSLRSSLSFSASTFLAQFLLLAISSFILASRSRFASAFFFRRFSALLTFFSVAVGSSGPAVGLFTTGSTANPTLMAVSITPQPTRYGTQSPPLNLT
ncbi:hypothetical protein E2C01_038847 [Portunus trituberculatus]|uniref:Uncharacterized protein n=1 Tax=Portunus trituberculatus TaxID=210409 RepID=A0A5B7FC07_PORTR|nr:hypothetical protein [Portunus trituberculatus]